MCPNATWKKDERIVNRDIGSQRNQAGTRGRVPDAQDRFLSVEVKNQKSVPKFLYKVLKQAEKRREGKDKYPVGVVRRKGKHKQITIMSWDSFLDIYKVFKREMIKRLNE